MNRFERKDVEEYLKDLATLKQTASVHSYIEEFEQLSIQVQNISPKRVIFLFIDGLLEPLKGLVKAFEPATLKDAIKITLSLESVLPPSHKFVAYNTLVRQPFSAKNASFG